MYIEEKLIAEIAKDIIEKKVVKPARRREQTQTKYGISIRIVCGVLSISATCYANQGSIR